ncbi:MAG: alpha-amylase, partial [Armatimonadetes bacterium]|nr:alpha-amylase [Armatimonadota bacterium]
MSLETLLEELRRREPEGERLTYRVPGLWAPVGESPTEKSRTVNPYRFLRGHVEAILSTPPAPRGDDDWVKDARIYNMFVRLTAAYDHDGDGRIATPDAPDRAARTLNGEGVRETGTFLKAIALLGHAKRMGCDTIHLLPVTAVGAFGNKGNLGSPYAIANPYRLEPTLADPLSAADVETQFAAFVEACHRLGMRVVVEFVFRTSSRDGDQVAKHPEWFYWIRREIEDRPAGAAPDDARYYGLPPFSEDDLKIMKEKVAKGEHTDLPPPPQWYRDLFKAPPARDTIQKEADGRWRGTAPDGTVVHVPSAFADWPPDDYQPPWTDVTYLRVYDRPKFNYIAYNTIRMYDEELAAPENAVQPLWDSILGIIPHYQDEFGVDGVMVDMGHALPHELMHRIIVKAR